MTPRPPLRLLLGFAALSSHCTFASPPVMVSDIERADYHHTSQPRGFTKAGALVYFFAYEGGPSDQTEGGLYKTDGTAAGTSRVAVLEGLSDTAPAPVVIGSTLYFVLYGTQLWRSNGTAAGTLMVRDLEEDFGGADIQHLMVAGTRLYFTCSDSTHGRELWTSTGTAASTVLVRDLTPGADSSFSVRNEFGNEGSFNEGTWSTVGTQLVFTFDNGTSGSEVWRSTGTSAGTVLLKNINANAGAGSDPKWLTAWNSGVYFSATDTAGDTRFWSTDGTAAGTVVFGPATTPFLPADALGMTGMGSLLYVFTGGELWKLNTAGGAAMVAGFDNALGETPRMWPVNGKLYWFARPNGMGGLWSTDGTTITTLYDQDTLPFDRVVLNNQSESLGRSYFVGHEPGAERWTLWRSNGTTGGTGRVGGQIAYDGDSFAFQLPPPDCASTGSLLIFPGQSVADETQPWAANVAAASQIKVINPAPRANSSDPRGIQPYSNGVLFSAYTAANGREYWKSDGTETGTAMIADVNVTANPMDDDFDLFSTRVVGNSFTFLSRIAPGAVGQPWISNGTAGGTFSLGSPPDPGLGGFSYTPLLGSRILLLDDYGLLYEKLPASATPVEIPLPAAIDSIRELAVEGPGGGYLIGRGDALGSELIRTNGTTAGTSVIKDINPGGGDSEPSGFVALGNKVYFTADDGTTGREPYVTTGTAAGTLRLRDINPDGDSGASDFRAVSDKVYFIADDGATGREPYVTNGTAAGTLRLKDINPDGDSGASHFIAVGTKVYFIADDGVHGRELFVTDGTTAGTQMVADINPEGDGPGSGLITDVDGILVFAADDNVHGTELWKAVPGIGGAQLIKDINPLDGSYPEFVGGVGGILLISVYDGSSMQLWRTDGTTTGTTMLAPANANTNRAAAPVFFNGALYFSADDGVHGYELWRTNGTAAGTAMYANIQPDAEAIWSTDGDAGSSPHYFTVTSDGSKLFFNAHSGARGQELYVLANETPQAVTDTFVIRRPGVVESLDVLANDSDPDGPRPTIVSIAALAVDATATTDGVRIYYTAGTSLGATGANSFTYTVQDAAGATATTTVSLTPAPFFRWQGLNFGAGAGNAALAGENADPDKDGLENLVEYAFQSNPNTSNRPALPTTTLTGSTMSLFYTEAVANSDITYQPEWSDNLTTWHITGFTVSLLSNNGTLRSMRASLPVSGPTARRLIRIKVLRQ